MSTITTSYLAGKWDAAAPLSVRHVERQTAAVFAELGKTTFPQLSPFYWH